MLSNGPQNVPDVTLRHCSFLARPHLGLVSQAPYNLILPLPSFLPSRGSSSASENHHRTPCLGLSARAMPLSLYTYWSHLGAFPIHGAHTHVPHTSLSTFWPLLLVQFLKTDRPCLRSTYRPVTITSCYCVAIHTYVHSPSDSLFLLGPAAMTWA